MNAGPVDDQVWVASAHRHKGDAEPDASSLSAPEHRRLSAMPRPDDQRRFITGRVLLRSVLGDLLAIHPQDVNLVQTCQNCGAQHGKIQTPDDPVQFSLTYAANLVVAVFNRHAAVGVDVAHVPEMTDDRELWAASLSHSEQAHLATRMQAENGRDFLTYWVRKEAVTKCIGVGLDAGLSDITVTGPGESPRLVSWPSRLDDAPLSLADLRIGYGDFVGAVALRSHTVATLVYL